MALNVKFIDNSAAEGFLFLCFFKKHTVRWGWFLSCSPRGLLQAKSCLPSLDGKKKKERKKEKKKKKKRKRKRKRNVSFPASSFSSLSSHTSWVWLLFEFFFLPASLCVCVCVWRKTDSVQVELVRKGDECFISRVRAMAVIFLKWLRHNTVTTPAAILFLFHLRNKDFLQATWVLHHPYTHPPPKQDVSVSAEGGGSQHPPRERAQAVAWPAPGAGGGNTCSESQSAPGRFLQISLKCIILVTKMKELCKFF